MAQQRPPAPTSPGAAPASSSDAAEPLASAAFRSVLPTLDSILQTLLEQSTSDSPPGSLEASSQVADKARELAGALEEMRRAAMALPGGGMSVEHIRRVSEALDAEADKRRAMLRAFGETDMPVVGEVLSQPRLGEESAMPSPARASS